MLMLYSFASVSALLTVWGIYRAKTVPVYGLAAPSMAGLAFAAVVVSEAGTLLTYEAVANANAADKEGMLASGLEVAHAHHVPTLVLLGILLGLHLARTGLTYRAGLRWIHPLTGVTTAVVLLPLVLLFRPDAPGANGVAVGLYQRIGIASISTLLSGMLCFVAVIASLAIDYRLREDQDDATARP